MIVFSYDHIDPVEEDFREILENLNVVDEFLHGWCFVLQSMLSKNLPGSELYQIYDKTPYTYGEFWNDHQVIKYKGKFIDVAGIYDSEGELIDYHIKDMMKMDPNLKIEDIECYVDKSDGDDLNWSGEGTISHESCKHVVKIIMSTLKELGIYTTGHM